MQQSQFLPSISGRSTSKMQPVTIVFIAAALVVALAEGQFYVPRAYYTIDAEGHASAPVPLRRLRRSLAPYPYYNPSGPSATASATANANANAFADGFNGANANANANARANAYDRPWGYPVPGGYGATNPNLGH